MHPVMMTLTLSTLMSTAINAQQLRLDAKIAFDQQGVHLLAGGDDLVLVDQHTLAPLRILNEYSRPIRHFSFSASGQLVAGLDADGNLSLIHLSRPLLGVESIPVFNAKERLPEQPRVLVSGDDRFLATATRYGVNIYKIADFSAQPLIVNRSAGNNNTYSGAIDATPDWKHFLIGMQLYAGAITKDGVQLSPGAVFKMKGSIMLNRLSADGSLAAALLDQGRRVCLINVKDGKELLNATLPKPATGLEISADGKTLLLSNGSITIATAAYTPAPEASVAVSAAGAYSRGLAIYKADGTVSQLAQGAATYSRVSFLDESKLLLEGRDARGNSTFIQLDYTNGRVEKNIPGFTRKTDPGTATLCADDRHMIDRTGRIYDCKTRSYNSEIARLGADLGRSACLQGGLAAIVNSSEIFIHDTLHGKSVGSVKLPFQIGRTAAVHLSIDPLGRTAAIAVEDPSLREVGLNSLWNISVFNIKDGKSAGSFQLRSLLGLGFSSTGLELYAPHAEGISVARRSSDSFAAAKADEITLRSGSIASYAFNQDRSKIALINGNGRIQVISTVTGRESTIFDGNEIPQPVPPSY